MLKYFGPEMVAQLAERRGQPGRVLEWVVAIDRESPSKLGGESSPTNGSA